MTEFLFSSEIEIEVDREEKNDLSNISVDTGMGSNTLSPSPTPTPTLPPSPSSSSSRAYAAAGDANRLFRTTMSELESNLPGEDRSSSLVQNGIASWAVVDGHGGLNACEIVNNALLKNITEKVHALSSSQNPADILKIIDESFQDCDRIVIDAALAKVRAPLRTLSQADMAKSDLMRARDAGRPGCCVVIVLVIGEYVYAANVGDCRAVLVSSSSSTVTSSKSPQSPHAHSISDSSLSFQTKDFIYDEFKSEGLLSRSESISSQSTELLSVTTSGTEHDNKQSSSNSNCDSNNDYVYEHDDFNACNKHYCVSAITKDHTCTSKNEKKIVSAMSKDPKPFRSSINDTASALAFKRVAGSLAITRAMGDGYLKHPELSFEPYIQYIPYITCRPTIKYKKLNKKDKYIILASDGLYNFVTASDVLNVVEELSPSSEIEMQQAQEKDKTYIDTTAINVNVTHAGAGTDDATKCDQNHQQQQEMIGEINIGENDQDQVGEKRVRKEDVRQGHKEEDIVEDTSANSSPGKNGGKLIRINACKSLSFEISTDAKEEKKDSHSQSFADLLIDRCISKAAKRYGGSLNAAQLRSLPQGKSRREIVDDITVITVDISSYVQSLGLDQ